MATPTHVQSTGWVADVSDVVTLTFAGVVTGNAILVGISQNSSTVRTYTVTDAQGNTYVQKQRNAPGKVSEIWEAHNVATTAGAVVVTITASTTATFQGIGVEVGNLGSADPSDAANQLDETTTTTHFCAPSGSIDTAAEVYVLCVAALGTLSTVITAGTDWTSLGGAGTPNFAQYRISATALTDERGAWTSGTSRPSTNTIASFKAPAAAGGSPMRVKLREGLRPRPFAPGNAR